MNSFSSSSYRTPRKPAQSDRASSADDGYLSIAQVTRLLNDTFEQSFPQVLFRGEISQSQRAQSGHYYFTLKDEQAQLSCVIWSGMFDSLSFTPAQGMVVRCHGRPNIYPGNGRFQFIVNRMVLDGEGELQRRFLELKARLERDGFFSPERKRPLPMLPCAVGIVTSKTGAVIHDMMVKIRERFPSMPVYLVDTRVQGEGAAKEIAAALRYLDSLGLVDVIIVARGGGSLEDLWAFNEEDVVKAVFSCSVPVISGVGHEVDVTLCDYVADVRAPTPTAAAEMVVPSAADLLAYLADVERRLRAFDRWLAPKAQRVDELTFRLHGRLTGVLNEARLRLKVAEASLGSVRPDKVLRLMSDRVAHLRERLLRAGEGDLKQREVRVRGIGERVQRGIPPEFFERSTQQLDGFARRLGVAVSRSVATAQSDLNALSVRLDSVNPRRVLERGYSIVRAKGEHIQSVQQIAVGGGLEITFADGEAAATVTTVTKG